MNSNCVLFLNPDSVAVNVGFLKNGWKVCLFSGKLSRKNAAVTWNVKHPL